uniref:WAP domain-containing protein n=1 Tax=Haplochromis burtoni TaxID=8153 RepID=A0A3Q2VC72_HAPBU
LNKSTRSSTKITFLLIKATFAFSRAPCLNGCCWVFLIAKPGVCPVRYYIHADCTESCSKDSDCHDNEKCCSNGCGHECMAPVIVKPGFCPHRLPAALGPCVESCSTDSDCHDSEKCCSNGCGHECMVPDIGEKTTNLIMMLQVHISKYLYTDFVFLSVKPGVLCPHRRFDNIMCGEFCSNDSDCPNNEKCCFSGCGHQCMAPYTVELFSSRRPLLTKVLSGLLFYLMNHFNVSSYLLEVFSLLNMWLYS